MLLFEDTEYFAHSMLCSSELIRRSEFQDFYVLHLQSVANTSGQTELAWLSGTYCVRDLILHRMQNKDDVSFTVL